MLARMINLRGTRARCAVVVAVGALLLAGCGTDDSAGGSTSAPTTPRDQLLLTQEEFPAGSTKMELPKDRVGAAAADLASAGQNGTFTPQECAGPQQDLGTAMKDLLERSSITAASGQSGAMYVEYIADTTADLARITELNAKCARYTFASSVEGARIDVTGETENRTAPADLKGVDAIVYRSTTSSSIGTDKPLVMSAYSGMATLRGLTVLVRVTALSDAADQTAFDRLFIAAVDKVRTAA